MNNNYKYEIAFSFLQEDEQLVLEIANRIRDRVSAEAFIYSERQNELAGTDGVERFTRVFAEEARVVVVLYRENWGQTPWTRVEETAIKSRGFDEGYEFVLLVKLDPLAKVPRWLPPTRIWLGYDRYGIDGVANAIETRVQDVGGTVHSESAINHAARLDRELKFKTDRSRWRDSEQGVAGAKEELTNLFNEFQRLAEEVNAKFTSLHIGIQRNSQDQCVLSSKGISLVLSWHNQYINTLNDSILYIQLFEGVVSLSPGFYSGRKPQRIQEVTYEADLDIEGQLGWREDKGKKRFSTSAQLADDWLKRLLEQIRKRDEKGNEGSVSSGRTIGHW